jgi:cytochrome b
MESPSNPARTRILVWDAPTRVFHWLLVLCFAGAYLTAEQDQWKAVHIGLGYTVAGLIGFRLIWGCFGTRYARFANFVRGPAAVASYLRSLLSGQPQHYLGHNPAGALAILVLLALGATVTASGWVALQQDNSERWEDIHETLANLMLAVVLVHVAAVALSSWLHRENLVAAMFSGKKLGEPAQSVRQGWRSVAILLLCAVAAFWWLLWTIA